MIFKENNLLNKRTLRSLNKAFELNEFKNGNQTAGSYINYNNKKNNSYSNNQSFQSILESDKTFDKYIKKISPGGYKIIQANGLLYNKGDFYDWHVDVSTKVGSNAFVDFAATIFLNDDYEGGEIEYRDFGLKGSYKGSTNSMFVYPASTLHRVTEIKKGIRKVVIIWCQASIPDVENRMLLIDLMNGISCLNKLQIKLEDCEEKNKLLEDLDNLIYINNKLTRKFQR